MSDDDLQEIYERARLIYKRSSSSNIRYMAKWIAVVCERHAGKSLGVPPAMEWSPKQ